MSSSDLSVRDHRGVDVDALGTLLRTELSACEAYRAAIRAVERDGGCPALSLRCLYRSHRRFADELRALIRSVAGRPAEPSGAWCVWYGVHERVAAADGRAQAPAALHALRHGERYSLEVAGGALDDLDGPAASWVRQRLVRGLVANLRLLAALERSAAEDSRGASEQAPADAPEETAPVGRGPSGTIERRP